MYFKLKLEMKSFLYYIYRLCNFIAVKKLTCYKMYRSNNSSFNNDDRYILTTNENRFCRTAVFRE